MPDTLALYGSTAPAGGTPLVLRHVVWRLQVLLGGGAAATAIVDLLLLRDPRDPRRCRSADGGLAPLERAIGTGDRQDVEDGLAGK